MNQEKIRLFTDLKAWQEGCKPVFDICKITKNFSKEERFGLTNQLRIAVDSLVSNIAEEFSRNFIKKKFNFIT